MESFATGTLLSLSYPRQFQPKVTVGLINGVAHATPSRSGSFDSCFSHRLLPKQLNMNVKRMEAFIACFIEMLALMGIFYQVFVQTKDYLAYSSYTSIAVEPMKTRLPAISLCASFWLSRMEDNYTALPMYNASRLMPSYEEVVNFCFLTLPNGNVIDCESITKPHKYMSHTMVCYSLFEEGRTFLPDTQLMYSHAVRKKNLINTPFLQAGLSRYWNDSEHSAITIRSHDTPIQLIRSSESKAWFEPKLDERVTIKYSITKRVELPPPHGSCKNYPPPFDADSSMVECWFDTYYKDETKTDRYWPWWVFFDYERNYTEEQLYREIPEDESDFAVVNRACMEQSSRVDCDNSYILLQKVTTQRTNKESGPIIITIPWLPSTQVNITNHIKTPLLEYFNQIGSILSMWMGFAIYPSYLQFISFAGKCMRAFTKRQQSSIEVSVSYKSPVTRSLLKKANNLFIGLLAWLTTVYFVVEIALIYFERPFIICIIAEIPMTIKMLGVSVCFDMVIHPAKVQQLYPDVFETVAPDRWKDQLTIEQLFKVTTEWDEVYDDISDFLSPDGTFPNIHEHFNFTKSLAGENICFTTFRQQEYLLPGLMKEHVRSLASSAENMLISLQTHQLNQLNQSRVHVYFHDDGLVREDHSASDLLMILGNEDSQLYANEYIIRTYRTTVKLFAQHMRSPCWEYEKKFGCKREIAFNKCMVNNFISKYGVWPAGYQVWQSSWPGRDMLMDSVEMGHLKISDRSMKEKLNRMYDTCDRLLRKVECERLIVKVGVEAINFHKGNTTEIVLYPSSKQFLVYEQQLIYSVIDLAGYIGGTIGTWIGLSFLDFEAPLILLLKLFKEKEEEEPQSTANPRLHLVYRRATMVHGWRNRHSSDR